MRYLLLVLVALTLACGAAASVSISLAPVPADDLAYGYWASLTLWAKSSTELIGLSGHRETVKAWRFCEHIAIRIEELARIIGEAQRQEVRPCRIDSGDHCAKAAPSPYDGGAARWSASEAANAGESGEGFMALVPEFMIIDARDLPTDGPIALRGAIAARPPERMRFPRSSTAPAVIRFAAMRAELGI